MEASESPQSEHFWLPSVSTADDPAIISGECNANNHSDELPDISTTSGHANIRFGTPEESNLRMDDDAPLCSIIGRTEILHSSSSKKPKAAVFRLPTAKKSRVCKELHRLPTPNLEDELPRALSSPEKSSLLCEACEDAEMVQPPKNTEKKNTKNTESKSKKQQTDNEKAKNKMMKNIGETAVSLEFPPKASGKKAKLKKKHKKKAEEIIHLGPLIDRTVIGVSLETALERNPSHDGVPLPAFFRYLIDFVENYGLAVEGIYRVPGVDSQVKQLINTLNNGVEFPDISPTSAGFYNFDSAPKSDRAKRLIIDSREVETGPPHFVFTPPPPPHDPAVVTSVIKHFLRSLPEPLLTTELGPLIETAYDQASAYSETVDISRRRRLAELIHRELPRPNRYLLAWLLQHMTRVIDRAGDNKMTLANLVIVFSPTLRMSHRLLALLLSQPSSGEEVRTEIVEADATRLIGLPNEGAHVSCPHWLFPHPAYTYRPYKPPLPPPPPSSEAAGMPLDLPDTLSELEDELFKQESLLSFIHQQITSGRASAEKDAYIWEVQHLVSKMKHKKILLELTDPQAICAELKRYKARLERVRQELFRCKNTESTDTKTIPEVPNTSAITSSEKVSRPMSSRLPVSQFNLVSPRLEKHSSGRKKRRPATATTKSENPLTLSLDTEFWELQQNVALLKRRLKECQNNPPIQLQVPRELVPSESLDIEEVFDFSLRKPIATAVMASAPVVLSEAEPLPPRPQQTDEAPSPKVESFPVEWPTAQAAESDPDSSKKNTIAEPIYQESEYDRRAEEMMTPVSERPTLPPDGVQEETEEEHQSLDPASHYFISMCTYWKVRQQELLACQHDLKSRIKSQEAEIARIEMCIVKMISTGKVPAQQVRQYLRENEHLLRIPNGDQHNSPSLNEFIEATTDDSEDDDDDDDDDEVEMAATLLQLMRDNARLEALNTTHIENIIAERDSCAHLKVQLRMSTCLPPPPLLSLQNNAFR